MDNKTRWRLIRVELMRRDLYMRDIATELGVTDALVSMTILGLRRNRRVRRAVSQKINIPYDDLWPENAEPKKAA